MRALISVSDKTGIVKFAEKLQALGVEIISTGGTYKTLESAGLKVTGVSDVTDFPECLDGRVKTLHPKIHAGILAMRSNPGHMKQLKELNVKTIDIVVVNLYPFEQTILKENTARQEAIENIDIGGPTMLRSAAKNYQDVAAVVDPEDYDKIIEELETNKGISLDTKFYLCSKVFEHTAHYDALIASYIKREREDFGLPETMTLTYEKVQDMRYGETPTRRLLSIRKFQKIKAFYLMLLSFTEKIFHLII
jgi:phosphoribosylaminoimidazolecarboxamide formyltransferase/IMP cyclohydrolase